jgi:transcription antitermination factor NusG
MRNNDDRSTYSDEVQELFRQLNSRPRPQYDPPDEVQGIIQQLSRLQLEQTDLLARLERAREVETRERLASLVIGDTTTSAGDIIHQFRRRHSTSAASDTPAVEEDQPRGFRVGDKVRITNPGRFQANRGEIIKIGTKRVTIKTRSGSKLQRAEKNLTFDYE